MKLFYLPIFSFLFFVTTSLYAADAADPVVTYHIAFDNLDFLKDCYVAQTGRKTPERRKLEIVPGHFGKALFLGSMPISYEEDNMSGIDLSLSRLYQTPPGIKG